MAEVESWYSNLTCESRMKFAALVALFGEEQVSSALVDNNDIDELFSDLANRIYGEAVAACH